jgi:hypothetical protein
MREYYKILEWLYLNDNKFSSREEWRKNFLKELKKLLLFRDEQQVNIIEVIPGEAFNFKGNIGENR